MRSTAKGVSLRRRQLLQTAGAAFALGLLGVPDAAVARAGKPFSAALLRARARYLASQPFRPPAVPGAALLDTIDSDAYRKIRFRPQRTLYGEAPSPFGVRLFHPGRFFKEPVRIFLLDEERAREVMFSPRLFEYDDPSLARRLPAGLGFAGLRLMNPGAETDWMAFQGASYFRSAGELDQYGLSARGLAIDTALAHGEEFPRFSEFYLEAPQNDPPRITIHALLEGPSVTGVYQFSCVREAAPTVDVRADVYARRDIQRLGLAPLTSMYWYSEGDRRRGSDWRPEIHDSDGLALWTGGGERLWRPLNNPMQVQTSSFVDSSPRGFGLLQRDRDFDHYEDDGAFYHRRPSVWVEPLSDWGAGSVQLVEIPTEDEIHDNIVAYWVPAGPARAGSAWRHDYRLHWRAQEPYPAALAQVVNTYAGRAGIPGQQGQRRAGRKFAIDFRGGPLALLAQRYDVTPVITAARGKVSNAYALLVVGTERWRAVFDLYVTGAEPVELRCFLRLGNRVLSETWSYQFLPRAAA